MNTSQVVEAVLFASDAPLDASEIARADPALDEDEVERAVQTLKAEYEDADRSFEIVQIAEGYQLLTRPEFAPYLERFDTVPRPNRLSGPAIEALAIIAYRQPIGRIEMEYIRGVSSAGVIRTLVERGLVDVVGRDEGIGRPLLYGTTTRFLEHFGFASLEDLPRPEELPVVLRERIAILPVDADEDPEQTNLDMETAAASGVESEATESEAPESEATETAATDSAANESDLSESDVVQSEAAPSDLAAGEPVPDNFEGLEEATPESDFAPADREPESV